MVNSVWVTPELTINPFIAIFVEFTTGKNAVVRLVSTSYDFVFVVVVAISADLVGIRLRKRAATSRGIRIVK